jgi:hypothetical protein
MNLSGGLVFLLLDVNEQWLMTIADLEFVSLLVIIKESHLLILSLLKRIHWAFVEFHSIDSIDLPVVTSHY